VFDDILQTVNEFYPESDEEDQELPEQVAISVEEGNE